MHHVLTRCENLATSSGLNVETRRTNKQQTYIRRHCRRVDVDYVFQLRGVISQSNWNLSEHVPYPSTAAPEAAYVLVQVYRTITSISGPDS